MEGRKKSVKGREWRIHNLQDTGGQVKKSQRQPSRSGEGCNCPDSTEEAQLVSHWRDQNLGIKRPMPALSRKE